MPKEINTAVQVPDLTYALYKGKVTIDFYNKFVSKVHAYNHVYIHRETGNWPISVTGATGMVDKSSALMLWQEKLNYESLLRSLPLKVLKETFVKLSELDPKDVQAGQGYSNGTLARRLNEVLKFPDLIKPRDVDAMLVFQATAQHKIKKEEGATIGGMVHDWIDNFLLGNKPAMPTDERVLNGVTAFLEWFEQNEVEIEVIDGKKINEKIVYSIDYDYVGKLDIVIRAKIPGKGNKKFRVLFDYKTNNWPEDKKTGETYSRIYPEQRYQQAGYRLAWEEELGLGDIGGRYLLSIDKLTGRFNPHFLDEDQGAYEKDRDCFLAGLTLKRRDKELSRGW